jgi:hypothetical protein
MQGLDMYNAFKDIPRQRLKRIREVLRTYYDIDIGNPTQEGHQALDNAVSDVIQPQTFECYSDSCVAYTGRLLTTTTYPTYSKRRYTKDRRARYTFQYIPLIPRLRLQYSHPTRSTQLSSYRASFDPSQPDNRIRNDVFHRD